jgi:hypothetical protein
LTEIIKQKQHIFIREGGHGKIVAKVAEEKGYHIEGVIDGIFLKLHYWVIL